MVAGRHAERHRAVEPGDRAFRIVPFCRAAARHHGIAAFRLFTKSAIAVLHDVADESGEDGMQFRPAVGDIGHFPRERFGAARLRRGHVGIVLRIGDHCDRECFGLGGNCERQAQDRSGMAKA